MLEWVECPICSFTQMRRTTTQCCSLPAKQLEPLALHLTCRMQQNQLSRQAHPYALWHLQSWYRKQPQITVRENVRKPSVGCVLENFGGCLQERGAFTLVLSGGSLFKALSPLIGLPGVDFSKWHIFFVDERNVPHSSPDSNFKGANDVLLSKVQIPRAEYGSTLRLIL